MNHSVDWRRPSALRLLFTYSLSLLATVCTIIAMAGSTAQAADAVAGQSTKEAEKSTLRLGVFDVDVSPPVGSPLAYDPCKSVAMSLRAKGIVIQGDAQPVVLCSVDWIGIANSAHNSWREALARAAGTTPDRVAVHCIHQHDAPFCDFAADAILAQQGQGGQLFDVKFAQRSIQRVADAVRQAQKQAVAITHVGIGQATVEKVASNRQIRGADGKIRTTRYTACADPLLRLEPEGTIDPRLKSISFWQEDQLQCVMTYYATHPQSYYRRGVANPDFPGMARELRQVTLNGIPHVHFNGAGGNIGAGKYNDGSADNRQYLAVRMADGMARALADTERHPVDGSQLTWKRTQLTIEPGEHLVPDQLQRVIADGNATAMQRHEAATNLAWVQRCRAGHQLDVTRLSIGPASIVHLPGEAVVEYQLYAQQLQPSAFVAVAGYGDYGTGYICLETHYAEGGYEASPRASRVAPDTEPRLKAAIRDVLSP